MTGAEMKSLREYLGLPLGWVAEKMTVQRRSVEYWESGRHTPPKDAQALLRHCLEQLEQAVKNTIVVAEEQTAEMGQPPQGIDLRRYKTEDALWAAQPSLTGYPVTYHAAIVVRAALELERLGHQVTIHYAEAEEPKT